VLVFLVSGVIDAKLFSLLVLMAVVTTVANGPLLDAIKPDPYSWRAAEPRRRGACGGDPGR